MGANLRQKPRRAAALVLVGWFLMAPPLRYYENKPFVDLRASLSLWQVRGTFSSATDCEEARGKAQKKLLNEEETQLETAARMDANINDDALATLHEERTIKCVSKNDPRLKEK